MYYDQSMEQWYPDEGENAEGGITVEIKNVKSEHVIWLLREFKETLDMAGAINQDITDDTEPVDDVQTITRRTRLNGRIYVKGHCYNHAQAYEMSLDLENDVDMMQHRIFKPTGGKAVVIDRWCD